MKHFPKLKGIPILVLSLFALASCSILEKKTQQRMTREGLETIVDQNLPEFDGFELVEIVSLDLSSTEYDRKCSYARDYRILGSLLSESEALEQYVEGLLSFGWTREGKQYPTTNTLVHGQNTRIVVRYGDPGVDIRDAVDYNQLRIKYQSIIFVRVDYMLPTREDC